MKTTLSRLFLLALATLLLPACDRSNNTAREQAQIEARAAQLAADQRIRDLEKRLTDAESLKATDREAELARVKEELAQLKAERDRAAAEPQPVAQQIPPAADNAGGAMQMDDSQVVEQEYAEEQEAPQPVGQVVPRTQYVDRVESFYEPLEPSGDWIETEDYGYVYQPTVAVQRAEWRPYTDGRWVETDYGWTWHSNEDFGWATYHYGRWAHLHRIGWVWVPGREWAPAWVSWRRGTDHCGWAPLPPESRTRVSFSATVDRDYGLGPSAYVFVSFSNFGARSYASVIERPERNVTFINRTVNITNITYNTANNQTVVYNGGPRGDRIRLISKQPVDKVSVAFTQAPLPAQNAQNLKTHQQGNTLQVGAPVQSAAVPAKPHKIREKVAQGQAQVEKGWETLDQTQAQKTRQAMAQTSKPLKNARTGGSPEPRPMAANPQVSPTVPPGTPAGSPAPTPEKPASLAKPRPGTEAPQSAPPEQPARTVVIPPSKENPDTTPVQPSESPGNPKQDNKMQPRPGVPGKQAPQRVIPPRPETPNRRNLPPGPKPPIRETPSTNEDVPERAPVKEVPPPINIDVPDEPEKSTSPKQPGNVPPGKLQPFRPNGNGDDQPNRPRPPRPNLETSHPPTPGNIEPSRRPGPRPPIEPQPRRFNPPEDQSDGQQGAPEVQRPKRIPQNPVTEQPRQAPPQPVQPRPQPPRPQQQPEEQPRRPVPPQPQQMMPPQRRPQPQPIPQMEAEPRRPMPPPPGAGPAQQPHPQPGVAGTPTPFPKR